MNRWPNFFIVGAPKAGTTTLYQYLKKIPGIYMSPVKEPDNFCRSYIPDDYYRKPIRDEKKYLDLFSKGKDETIVGEASPSYLADLEAPKLIHQVSPNAKILISLRDPVNRLYSAYLMYIRTGWCKHSFRKEIEKDLEHLNIPKLPHLRLSQSLYHEQVAQYLKIFGENQVKIIIFEEFVKTQKETVKEIIDFLDLKNVNYDLELEAHNPFRVKKSFLFQIVLKKVGRHKNLPKYIPYEFSQVISKMLSKKAPKPQMNQEDRKFLIKYYLDDVQKLKELLGMELPWPSFKV